MVDTCGLLLGLGVRTMRELEQFLNTEAEWVLERLSTGTEANDRNYYQGRVDQLAQVRRFLQLPQLIIERESELVLCGDCLRSDCYHLEQVKGRK